ncbi:hypothetical protein [Terribacillus saccharophilus]|uniref:hypothetical protein n=1 Tax=Terribacillus saccharophilus TaxID=361277 RepID=UPI003D2BDB03
MEGRLSTAEGRIAALESAAQPEAAPPTVALRVGDYAKVIGNGDKGPLSPHHFPEGTIVEIVRDVRKASNGPVHVYKDIDGKLGSNGVATVDLEKIPDEEAQQIEADRKAAAKFAEIGRAVGEFKAGDIVRVTGDPKISAGHDIGTVGEVHADYDGSGIGPEVKARYKDGRTLALHSPSELITPVERRFDR